MIAAFSALALAAAAPFPATFAAPDTQSPNASSGIATLDVDGRPVFVTAGGTSGVVTVGATTYRVNPADATDSPTAVATGDLNRDGRTDLVTANSGERSPCSSARPAAHSPPPP